MEEIISFVEDLLLSMSVSADAVPVICHVVLIVVAVLLAWLAGWICKLFIPLILKLTKKTEARWDDALFNEQVLRSACQVVPALVVWQLLPNVFYDVPTVHELLARLTAIYITVMTVRTALIFADSFRLLESGQRTSKQQYLYSFIGIMKIILIFIAVIIVISIIVNKNPTTLLAGLGAASAIMMLVFQSAVSERTFKEPRYKFSAKVFSKSMRKHAEKSLGRISEIINRRFFEIINLSNRLLQ